MIIRRRRSSSCQAGSDVSRRARGDNRSPRPRGPRIALQLSGRRCFSVPRLWENRPRRRAIEPSPPAVMVFPPLPIGAAIGILPLFPLNVIALRFMFPLNAVRGFAGAHAYTWRWDAQPVARNGIVTSAAIRRRLHFAIGFPFEHHVTRCGSHRGVVRVPKSLLCCRHTASSIIGRLPRKPTLFRSEFRWPSKYDLISPHSCAMVFFISDQMSRI